VLTAWQERKKEERRHPFLDESAPLGLVPYLQAQLLARHLRGDLDAYPPWFWK
jgi:CRISPR-associated protein Cas1